ncbi:MAG: protein kinase [Candidatus Melainabacteria bacterium]|nr:protein kinase [Candidatus Melainabacteria bacterium]
MTFTPTTNDPLIGKILAERYRITELVGAGRFSIVYKGQHLFMDRAVAMKTLQSNLVEDQTVIKRFEKEAVALSKLRHPNIVSVYDCFVHTNGQPFLVMDFLDGHTLEELLNDRGAIPPKLMRAIIFQASAGLAHAHASGVLHRDIKPDNIILLPREKTDERVRLLDFGFALLQGDLERLTLSGTLCGSPAYISPERWKGKELDARSDIYSLAVVMFQGLTGQLPFKANSLEDLRNMHVSQDPPMLGDLMPSLRDDVTAQQIMNRALAKDPDQRYQTMKDFHNAIKLWSPNSDDAEIANWAKNATPKPPPSVVQQGQPVLAQPISLQPLPSQAVPPQAAGQTPGHGAEQAAPQLEDPANSQHIGAPSAPKRTGQNTLRLPAANDPESGESFDDAATLPNNSGPAFDDAVTLPTNASRLPVNAPGDSNLETLTASAANSGTPGDAASIDPSQQHKGYISVDINEHPLSPEALARIAKPNPRASLTRQDVAYIKAIAQTLGDSLGEQAKSIDVPPNLEEELHMAPRDETSRLNFSAMPPPVVESKIPEPGPKVVPIVDRRQKRSGEITADNEPVPGSSWGVIDGAPAPLPDPKPIEKVIPLAAGGAQPVSSEWSAKQEVAPWVKNPDGFKPKTGLDSTLTDQPTIKPASMGNTTATPPGAAATGTPQGAAGAGTLQGSAGTGTPQGSTGAPGAPATTPLSGSFGTPATPDPPGSFGALQNESLGSPQGSFGAPAAGTQGAFGTPQGSQGSSGSPAAEGAFPTQRTTGAPPTQGSPGAPAGPAVQGPQVGVGAFGTPIHSRPPGSPTNSSSRISPVLPGAPGAASNSAPGSAPGSSSGSASANSWTDSQVPWTNVSSSSPVDFGKMFPDNDKTIATGPGASAMLPPLPGVPPTSLAGTEIASPTASAANLSISTGNDRSQPPKTGKKRNRLPTFVDRDMPEDGAEPAAAAPKKGNAGMLIAGVAVAIFVFAGIGIATWMITNVNPSNNPANSGANSPANTPVNSADNGNTANNSNPSPATSASPSTAPVKTDTDTAAPAATITDATATDTASSNDKDTSTASSTSASTTAKDTDTGTGVQASAPDDAPEAPNSAESTNSSSTPKASDAPANATVSNPQKTAPPGVKPVKEPPQSTGWFGFPSFNKNNPPSVKQTPPHATAPAVTASSEPAAPPKPRKKKPKKKRTAVARKAAPAASSSGYVEVEVTPGRRAYRSY